LPFFVNLFEITESGTIIVRGEAIGPSAKSKGPLTVFIPSFSENGTSWRCFAAPREAAQRGCLAPDGAME